MDDTLRKLAARVAQALTEHPEWGEDALEVRDRFDAFIDAALRREADDVLLAEWLV